MAARRGELTKISALFAKYQTTLKPPQATVERAVCTAINERVGCSLAYDQVRYTVATKTIYVSAPSVLKQEIRLSIPEILEEIRTVLPKETNLIIL